MKEIALRGLNNPLSFVINGAIIEVFPSEDSKFYDFDDEEEDDSFTETETYEIYQDKINNNVIVYSYSSFEEEEIPKDITKSISNSICNSAFDYLINVLNNSKNKVVYWSQVDGTTSDYIIYYDIEIPEVIDYNSIYDLTVGLFKKNVLSYKYVEVKNGIHSKIEV